MFKRIIKYWKEYHIEDFIAHMGIFALISLFIIFILMITLLVFMIMSFFQ